MLTPLTRRTRWLPVSAEHITETMCCVHQCSVHFAGARWNLVHDPVAVAYHLASASVAHWRDRTQHYHKCLDSDPGLLPSANDGLFCPSTELYGPVLLYTKLHTGTVRSVGVLVPPRYLRCRQLCHQRRRPLLQDCSAGQELLMHHHQYLQLWYHHMVCRVSSHQLGSRCTPPR